MANENLINVKTKIIVTSAVMTATAHCMIFVIGSIIWRGVISVYDLIPLSFIIYQVWYLYWGWNWLKGVKITEWKAVNETVQKDLDSVERVKYLIEDLFKDTLRK
jgi:hypothetical protein